MTVRPRAVFLSPIMPNETGNGLAMRMGMFVKALSEVCELHLVVVPIAGGKLTPSPSAELAASLTVLRLPPRPDPEFDRIRQMQNPIAQLAAFRSYGRPAAEAYLTDEMMGQITAVLARIRPRLLHIGRAGLISAASLAGPGTAVSVDLDEDDASVLSARARVLQAKGKNAAAEWARIEAGAYARSLALHAHLARVCFVSSQLERDRLTNRLPALNCQVVVNAVDIPPARPAMDDGLTLLFVGALGFEPNVDAICGFVRDSLPLIQNALPVRLLIAGADAPPEIASLVGQDRIEVLGFVPDLGALYAQSTIALAPLSYGGGTRIKLLEASAQGKPWLATPVGAEGVNWPDGIGGWIAPSGKAFATACIEALNNPAEREMRAQAGRAFVAKYHDRDMVIRNLAQQLNAFFV